MFDANVAVLAVDLRALRANYRLLKSRHAKKNCAAVVKANAYGLGVEQVSKALWQEGAREFFVATLEEGIELRAMLPEARIAVLNGIFAGEEKEYAAHRLTPVVNDLAQLASVNGQRPVILHIDTGLTRLGLSEPDLKKLSNWPPAVDRRSLIMSHLASANEPDHPQNAEQLARFQAALKYFPRAGASLCNSAGLFLGPEFHFDIARPGGALYGIHSTTGENPLAHVATLLAPILQIRKLERNEMVGYGATFSAKKGARIAIVGLGYADGLFRSLSNRGFAYIEGKRAPIVGRVSMDLTALDVSAIPETKLTLKAKAEFINAQHTVNDMATVCDTIGYENIYENRPAGKESLRLVVSCGLFNPYGQHLSEILTQSPDLTYCVYIQYVA